MNDEYEQILKDLDFIKKIPENLNFGFFLIEVKELKNLFISSINQIISRLNKLYEKTIYEILLRNNKLFEDFMERLTREPKDLEEYIEIKLYINGKQYQQSCDDLVQDMRLLNNCISTLNTFCISIPDTLIEKCYISSSWIPKIEITKKETDNKLDEMRPKMKKNIEERKNFIFEGLEYFKNKIKAFSEYYNLGEAYDISNSSKEIHSALKSLIEKGKILNTQEEFLKFSKTNFSHIQTLLNDFDKYHNLWDFAEKWKFVT